MSTARLLQMSGVVVDLVYRVEEVPKAGQEAIVEESMIAPGGGFNAMVAASRAGMPVSYGGAHGTGRFADIVRSAISEHEIPVLQNQLGEKDQGTCVVLVDRDGERTFISQAGAERYFGSAQFDRIDLSKFDFVLISGYTFALCNHGDVLEQWLDTFPDGPKLVFDPSPIVEQISSHILKKVFQQSTWVSANASEAASITGYSQPDKAAEALCTMMGGRSSGALVRNGGEGCWLALPGASADLVPAFKVGPIDTNGAGDAHVGAFIAELSRSNDPVHAAKFANAAAALSTLAYGPATAPALEQIHSFMEHQTPASGEVSDLGSQKILQSTNI
ncbi:MAG: PfkB family carbohydrate kinase [Pseudomonadota bacterium]